MADVEMPVGSPPLHPSTSEDIGLVADMQHHQIPASKTSEATAPHGFLHSSLLTGPFPQLVMPVISEGLMGDPSDLPTPPSDLRFHSASHTSGCFPNQTLTDIYGSSIRAKISSSSRVTQCMMEPELEDLLCFQSPCS